MSSIIYVSLVTFLLSLSFNALAQWDFDNSGSRIFDMRDNTQKQVSLTLVSVDAKDIRSACDKKSRELGHGGFSYEPLACAFWRGKTCHIIVPHKIDMRSVGHEVMHCFQGDWHKQPRR